ncbi:PfkB family carbohydrate kinase [Blastopirellula sp. JC732]|uniref:PfkB family carbohydrate kinase n=1 Tax=Blastopirellula sediminis TaxID=2894196 RepID=A0A9X1MNX0_9BACT|nr:PfkB family carbohydrate kinase [Blastopirellula sediminis]MCC9607360.1 PfkB family carbohydrate kinase [Blastopirellula sediminis]MCC9629347.1 PfkB family carbohydrate kinase [Blastopirellula sediminis]
MPLLVVGSIALDSVHTPTEVREDVLGGSAVYFSYAASYFTGVKLVGVVGEDWPSAHTDLLKARNVDTAGLEIVEGGETFRWTGKYQSNMNDRDTLEVHLNVLENFSPTLPDDYRRSPFLFLANGAPSTQMKVLEQMTGPKLVVADTMDLWIEIARDDLEAMLKKVDGLVLNDSEAKKLTEDENLVRAGRKVLEMGPKFVVLKKGEHGAMFFSEHETYVMPAFPTETVVDPTGAGDSFAGGMMGYLAEKNDFSPASLKEAMAYGTVVASFNVEDFSLEKMKKIERADVDARFAEYRQMLSF